jgi:hypothetical protein
MNPSKIHIRNLIDFGLISLLELRDISTFKFFVGVIVAAAVQGASCNNNNNNSFVLLI